ncbi:membrane-associated protein, putative [Bodo saltans]|uniref:Membrane-associated protein, putative n=1 Tax=Bodo saltans TaxID=75058 RepID=A0A0S4IQQ2_BODSA|nr:membrane-associated protein, putative [Bodo saltans]|eukprot:CUF26048.1 membrane-associated protein, putative [Bodo saltans]
MLLAVTVLTATADTAPTAAPPETNATTTAAPETNATTTAAPETTTTTAAPETTTTTAAPETNLATSLGSTTTHTEKNDGEDSFSSESQSHFVLILILLCVLAICGITYYVRSKSPRYEQLHPSSAEDCPIEMNNNPTAAIPVKPSGGWDVDSDDYE